MPNGLSDIVNAGKAKVLSAFFISVFTDTVPRHFSPVAGTKEQRNSSIRGCSTPGVLRNLVPYKSINPDGIYLRVLSELADVTVRLLSVIF